MCVFFISSTAMFFAFAIIEYKKFRRPGNFFPLGEKNFLVCSSFGLGRLSSFFGGGEGGGARRLMRRPAPTMLFLFAFVSSSGNLYVNLLVIIDATQSIRGIGSKEVNEKSSTYHAVSICILLLDTLCVRNYVNLLLGR